MPSREGYHWNRVWRPSPRQRQVLDLLVEGKTNAELAEALGISPAGVRWQISELLGETGLEDRQALGRWWVEERERYKQPAFLTAWLARPRTALSGSVAVVAVLAAAGWLLLGRDGGGETVPSPVEVPAVDEGLISGAPIRPFEPLFHDFLIELTVEGGNGDSRVDLRDIKTGDLLGSVSAGYRPMVVVRKQAQELLVASGLGPVDPEAGFHKVVQVYDLRDSSLELKRTIEVPNRVNCTTYCQPLVLSQDERYLYYASRTFAPECGRGGDAAVCDIHHIVAVDLEDEGAPPVSTELQRGCGVPRLSRAGADGVVVTCLGQYPVRGGWTRFIGPNGEGRTLQLDFYRPLFNLVTSQGDVVLVTESGSLTKVSPTGEEITGYALPRYSDLGFSARVFYIGNQELGDDRIFLMFDPAPCFFIDGSCAGRDRTFGFAVFDLSTMQLEGYARVPGAAYYVPQGESVYLLRQGRIEVLDLATGRLDVLTDAVGRGVEALLPGR